MKDTKYLVEYQYGDNALKIRDAEAQARIKELEAKVALQEQTIEDLTTEINDLRNGGTSEQQLLQELRHLESWLEGMHILPTLSWDNYDWRTNEYEYDEPNVKPIYRP